MTLGNDSVRQASQVPRTVLGAQNTEVAACINRRGILSGILGSRVLIITPTLYASTQLVHVTRGDSSAKLM